MKSLQEASRLLSSADGPQNEIETGYDYSAPGNSAWNTLSFEGSSQRDSNLIPSRYPGIPTRSDP